MIAEVATSPNDEVPAAAMAGEDRCYYFILNTPSGTASSLGLTAETLRLDLAQAGHRVVVDDDENATFETRIARAEASDCEVIVAAGGDGTVSAVAGALINSDKILAVLPLGTVNSLVRDLGMPLDLKTRIGSLSTMETQWIDVGEVNGQIFLHMVVIGLIPGMAAGRELLRGRTDLGAKIGLLRYIHRRLSRARRLAMQIDPSNEDARIERVQAVAITCNAYDEGFARIMTRQQLNAGELTLYQVGHLGIVDALRLAFLMFLGHWQQDQALKIQKAPSVIIRSHKPRLRVMLDGEIENISVPLQFRIRPRALRVLSAPATTTAGRMLATGVEEIPHLSSTGALPVTDSPKLRNQNERRQPALIGGAVAGVLVVLFAALSWAILTNRVAPFDNDVSTAIQSLRNPILTGFMRFATYLASWQVVIGGSAAVLIFQFSAGRSAIWSRMLLVAVIGDEVIVWTMKDVFRRVRPDQALSLMPAFDPSFPSGHSFIAVVFYGALTWIAILHMRLVWLKLSAGSVCVIIVFGVGMSRVYLGAHWPTDVLGSYLLGTAWIIIVGTIVRRLAPDETPPGPPLRARQFLASAVLALWIGLVVVINYVSPGAVVNIAAPVQ